jgi:hypothetical protein
METFYKIDQTLHKMIHDHEGLFEWCLQNAADRFMGELTQDQIDKLDCLDFPWDHYENILDKMGFNWKANNPSGIRYKDMIKQGVE